MNNETMTTELHLAMKLIDDAMTTISGRNLVSSNEMCDILLDIRLTLMSIDAEPALV